MNDCATRMRLMLLTAAQEAALVKRSTSAVSRARKDTAHPACMLPDGTFVDARTKVLPVTRGGPVSFQVQAPRDAVLAFWAARRPGPKPKTEEAARG